MGRARRGLFNLADDRIAIRPGRVWKRPVGALKVKRVKPDDLIVTLAAGQHGVVTRTQLLRAGVPNHVVKHRIACARLQRVHAGVYRVGPMVAPHAREAAAVLACGAGAVLSHRGALSLLQLAPPPADVIPVDVTVVLHDRGRRPGIRVHRVRSLTAEDVTTVEGIAVTAPARTLIDVAATARARELEQALAQAQRRQLVSAEALLERIARHPRRRGMKALKALLLSETPPALTRSEAEERFLALVRKTQLPEPGVNVMVAGFEVDFLWQAAALAVEIDGYAFHSSPRSFERDRLRDAALTALGFRVIRVTWRQIEREPWATVMRVGQALARSG